ncbi:hypothetical protein HK098_008176 [Nowakowskiella sp. JEL0407]|nr:hypothetical protein HK098_008176 [Nowakowskiella sp. JEL0407]
MATTIKLRLPWIQRLNQGRVVLASGSPRRKEILRNVGIDFEVQVSKFEENLEKSWFATPADYVRKTSEEKGREVFSRLTEKPLLLISADTIVVYNSQILEKPKSKLDAISMLSELSGNTHQVLTAVTLFYGDGTDFVSFLESTDVCFGKMDGEEVEAYVDTQEPMDKAGGYGYQGIASVFIEKINGCYFNVVGFPISAFAREVKQLVNESKL